MSTRPNVLAKEQPVLIQRDMQEYLPVDASFSHGKVSKKENRKTVFYDSDSVNKHIPMDWEPSKLLRESGGHRRCIVRHSGRSSMRQMTARSSPWALIPTCI
jgi:hypothetical protein